ncbi:acyltransferase [Cnuibacter physcomitrellae]|uniref:acyltransferase n=1 Tax=Cnuibacter physcomitrellae TaxID=1619308 RepID=UPI0035C78807
MAWIARRALLPHRFRPALYRAFGVAIGHGVLILDGVEVTSSRLRIGDRVFLNRHVFIDCQAEVSIGNDVQIGNHVKLITSTHAVGPSSRRAGESVPRPVSIGDGCWLGADVVVLPGVRVAAGCIIAAGAVVTVSTDPDGLYAGVPARRVKDLS